MSGASGWEMVGWGTPTPNIQASEMFTGDDPGWNNIEKGERAPTDADIERASDAVYKDQHGGYHTVSLAWFDTLEELEDYIDEVLSGEYE